VIIACSNGKKLAPEDIKAIEDFMKERKARKPKSQQLGPDKVGVDPERRGE
jgi:hypothetical protein